MLVEATLTGHLYIGVTPHGHMLMINMMKTDCQHQALVSTGQHHQQVLQYGPWAGCADHRTVSDTPEISPPPPAPAPNSTRHVHVTVQITIMCASHLEMLSIPPTLQAYHRACHSQAEPDFVAVVPCWIVPP